MAMFPRPDPCTPLTTDAFCDDTKAFAGSWKKEVPIQGRRTAMIVRMDEPTYAKKGTKTPGIKRQYYGSTGKKDNCVVRVHLSCSHDSGFRALLGAQ